MNRNYSSLPYCYAKQGENEFIMTSEDYQCITIINLHTKEINTYGNIESVEKGWGFCPIKFTWDEDCNELKINGCYWGAPYEDMVTIIPDLNNPDFNSAEYIEEPIENYDDDKEEMILI